MGVDELVKLLKHIFSFVDDSFEVQKVSQVTSLKKTVFILKTGAFTVIGQLSNVLHSGLPKKCFFIRISGLKFATLFYE